MKQILPGILFAALGMGTLSSTMAAPYEWGSTTVGGDWGIAGNWNPAVVPDDASAAVSFQIGVAAPNLITIATPDDDLIVNSLTVTGSATSGSIILSRRAGRTLTFAGDNPFLTVAGNSGGLGVLIYADLRTSPSTGTFTIGNGLASDRPTRIQLAGNNIFSNGVTLNSASAGEVLFQGLASLNGAALTMRGSGILGLQGDAAVNPDGIAANWTSNIILAGSPSTQTINT